MQWLSDKIDNALAWLGHLVQAIFTALLDLLMDVAVNILEALLNGVLYVIGLLPVPTFASGGMQPILNQLPSGVLYFLQMSGMVNCLAVLAAGLTFRLLRKFFTLGQW